MPECTVAKLKSYNFNANIHSMQDDFPLLWLVTEYAASILHAEHVCKL